MAVRDWTMLGVSRDSSCFQLFGGEEISSHLHHPLHVCINSTKMMQFLARVMLMTGGPPGQSAAPLRYPSRRKYSEKYGIANETDPYPFETMMPLSILRLRVCW